MPNWPVRTATTPPATPLLAYRWVDTDRALADQLARAFKLAHEERPVLLMCGIAAGFGSVFGTPLAGAVFALEVLAVGRLHHAVLLPCLVAALLADRVALLWGVTHAHYAVAPFGALSLLQLGALLLAGVLFGLTARLFARASHALAAQFKRRIAWAPLRPLLGGCMIATLAWSLGAERYLALMRGDKKSEGGDIKFVLIGNGPLSAGGSVPGTATTQSAPEALVREVLAACTRRGE